jgi:Cu+-exporting ATPase
LRVDGMTCGNCARQVTDALQKVPGVLAAPVDLTAATARVVW